MKTVIERKGLFLAIFIANGLFCTSCGGGDMCGPAVAGLGIQDAGLSDDAPPTPYNRVFRFVTHNSYWVNRDDYDDYYASGVEERILDQMLIEHVRGLEIDVHTDKTTDHQFTVYHTNDLGNSFCTPLSECMKMLRVFHFAIPEHEVVNVVVELKELDGPNFPDEKHTPDDLDDKFRLLGDANGSWLFQPRDLLARCPGTTTLVDCVKNAGWPNTHKLRGKFIVSIIGNYELGAATAPIDWVKYATFSAGGVIDRVGFPMATNTMNFHGVNGVLAALQSSVFEQVENLSDPGVPTFLRQGGVVRGQDAFRLDVQLSRQFAGFQMVQTDHPWFEVDDDGPDRPFHSMDTGQTFAEPGLRLMLRGSKDDERFAFAAARAEPSTPCSVWSTLPSTTRTPTVSDYEKPSGWRARGHGCLRAAADASDSCADSVTVCRAVVNRENAQITVDTCTGRKCTQSALMTSAESATGGVGDLLQLSVCTNNGISTVVASSASEVDVGGNPIWVPVAQEALPSLLLQQGVAGTRDVLFVNTRRDGAPVRGADLYAPRVVRKQGQPDLTDAALIDLSH